MHSLHGQWLGAEDTSPLPPVTLSQCWSCRTAWLSPGFVFFDAAVVLDHVSESHWSLRSYAKIWASFLSLWYVNGTNLHLVCFKLHSSCALTLRSVKLWSGTYEDDALPAHWEQTQLNTGCMWVARRNFRLPHRGSSEASFVMFSARVLMSWGHPGPKCRCLIPMAGIWNGCQVNIKVLPKSELNQDLRGTSLPSSTSFRPHLKCAG